MSTERNFETLEAGAEYEARNGLHVKIVGEGAGGLWLGYSVRAPREVNCWHIDGGFSDPTTYVARLPTSGADLIRKIEPKRVVWVNIYSGRENTYCTTFVSREVADRDAVPNARVARIRVEYTPGQFDE